MNHYFEIRIRPDPEFSETMLLGALVGKLHRGLVAIEASDVGISFPEHSTHPRSLGGLLRVHGERSRLEALNASDWFVGMRDHVTTTEILPTPPQAQHRVVKRRQYKTSAERLRRRRMRRHQQNYEEAQRCIPDSVERRVETPFVMVRSRSTGETFCLFVEHGDLCSSPVPGAFNAYGLSKVATVPWF